MFEDILSSLTVDQLKTRLSLLLKARRRPTRKAEIVDVIREQMLSPNLWDYWEELDELEKKSVAEAVHNWSGEFEGSRFAAKYGELPEYFQRKPYHSYESNRTPPKRTLLPLFFYARGVPDELAAQIKTVVPAPGPDILRVTDEKSIPRAFDTGVAESRGGSGATLQFPVKALAMEAVVRHDLPAVLRLVDTGQVTVSEKTALAGAASLRKIEDVLMGGDYYAPEEEWEIKRWQGSALRPMRPFAWPLLLQTGGMAKRNGKRLELTRKGKNALQAPLEDSVKELYERWLRKAMLDEFRRIDLVKGQTGKGRRMAAATDRRLVIEDALGNCSVGDWFAVDELFRYMRSQGQEFEVAYDPWKLYVVDSNYGTLGYSSGDFRIMQARYILAYLFEYLATLGLVDIAFVPPYYVRHDYSDLWGTDELVFLSRYDGLLYIRLNPLGVYCLGLSGEYKASVPRARPLLSVDDQLRIRLEREPEPGELMVLEQYAGADSGGVWQLAPDYILAALSQGKDAGLFHNFLRERAVAELPAEVDELFEAVEGRRTAITDGGRARLLRCSSPALAEMIARDPATKAYCLLTGDRTLVVPEKTEKSFSKGLQKLGYIYPQN